jgi:hypothetical protein
MKIKDHAKQWPPIATAGTGEAELADTVQSAQRDATINDHIGLGMRRADGTEYGASLVVPANLVDKTAVAIVRKLPISLGDVGEMEI